MARTYICQLRRGWKDDERDDWADYENGANPIHPLAGELVLEYDHGVPRLKIGDGVTPFSQLEYMSVDSFILPKPISITINENSWVVSDIDKRWHQEVTVNNARITPNSKVDLQPDSEQLVEFYQKGLAFVAENDGGAITVYCIGRKPEDTYTITATVTEVVVDA